MWFHLWVHVKFAVTIHHIFISPGHNFFGHYGTAPGEHGTTDMPVVRACAGLGLEGDRFYGYRPDYKGQVTFFEWGVYEAIKAEFMVPELRADAFRRNILIEGAHLNDLIGARFSIGDMEFEGMSECTPCAWMDSVVAPGAEKWLRSRGGLRAKILTDGELRRGPAELAAHGLLALG
jgi:MOSC domain-containing protein YiiM